jgi:hypothetical protein
MVEATGLKLWHQGRLQLHDLPTEFHKSSKVQVGSKVDSGTDTQTGR